jgi:hypothetical protein
VIEIAAGSTQSNTFRQVNEIAKRRESDSLAKDLKHAFVVETHRGKQLRVSDQRITKELKSQAKLLFANELIEELPRSR